MAKILIYETCQERANGLYRQVQWHYNTATDAVESQINSGVNSCSAYAYSTTNPLHFFCVEGTTTRKTVFHAGNGTVRYEETLNSPDCGYNPPGGNPKPEDCNLVVTSAEASPSRKGANNGLVVIEVTGGTLPMEYSIDGVNFGTNNYIGNLPPGNYFAYARKGNQVACIANKAFTVAELPGITIEVSSGCEGGLGFIDLNVSSPESETFFIDLLNQTTQENIHEEITATTSYSFMYTNLSNGAWLVKVKGSLNTFEVLSAVQKLQCSPGTGNGQGGKRISEMEELDALNDQVYFPVIDLTETDTSKQNKKIHRSKLPLGTGGGTTVVGGGLQKKAVTYVSGTNTYAFPFPITGKNFDSADVLGENGQIWEMDFEDPADNATEITFTNPKPIGAGLLRLWYNPAGTSTGGENPSPGTTANTVQKKQRFLKTDLLNGVLTLPDLAVAVTSITYGDDVLKTRDLAGVNTDYDYTHILGAKQITFETGAVAAMVAGQEGVVEYFTNIDLTIPPTTGTYTPTIQVSAEVTKTLATTIETYVFNGTSLATWTLPAVSNPEAKRFIIKNRGTVALTIQGASNSLYFDEPVTSHLILPGDAYTFHNDGTYYNIL